MALATGVPPRPRPELGVVAVPVSIWESREVLGTEQGEISLREMLQPASASAASVRVGVGLVVVVHMKYET